MLRLKSAIMGLKKRWIFSLLLLVQITYGLSTITGSANVFYNLYYLSHQSVLDLNSTYLVIPEKFTGVPDSRNVNMERVREIYEDLDTHPDVIGYGTYEEQFIFLDNVAGNLPGKMAKELTKSHSHIGINGIVIDENYSRTFKLPLAEGRSFEEQDFTTNNAGKINVLVGSYFQSYFKTGDTINDQYVIIGFLRDRYIVNNNMSNLYLKLDKAMILPMSNDRTTKLESMFGRLNNGMILKLREGSNPEEFNPILQLPGNDSLTLKNLGEYVRHNIRANAYIELPQLILGAAFMLFSIMGIMVTTIVSILIRKRDFGIKMVLGESKYGIYRQIAMENFLVGITGMGLSLLHFRWKFNGLMQYAGSLDLASPLDFKLNVVILFLVFLILLLIMVISNFIVFWFVSKLEPKAMIGGME